MTPLPSAGRVLRALLSVIMLAALLSASVSLARAEPSDPTRDPGSSTAGTTRGRLASTADLPRNRLVLAPADPVRGEKVVLTIKFRAVTLRRPALLQRKDGARWQTVERTRTSAKGAARFATHFDWPRARLRVNLPGIRVGGQRHPAVMSRPRLVVAAVQKIVADPSPWFEEAVSETFSAQVTPVRAGRLVQVQELVDGAWLTRAVAEVSADGSADLTLGFDAEGVRNIRIVALRHRGAPPTRTDPFPIVVGRHQQLTGTVEVASGSSVTVGLSETLDTVRSVVPVTVGAVSVGLSDQTLVAAATADAVSGSEDLVVHGRGCFAGVCGIRFELMLTVDVTALADSVPAQDTFTQPSPDRADAAEVLDSDTRVLNDELVMVLGTALNPGSPSVAENIAQTVGAFVTGAIAEIGVYELRWINPPADLDAVVAEIEGMSEVTSVARTTLGLSGTGTTIPPGDWDDDTFVATWHFAKSLVPEAWDEISIPSVSVGILDGGAVLSTHEDLSVSSTITDHGVSGHATHVAGLACAMANGTGLVGAAWGCPVVSAGAGSGETWEAYEKNTLPIATKLARSGVKVVNMSLGRNVQDPDKYCISQETADTHNRETAALAAGFRHLFNGPLGRDIVWTLSAGNNCGTGVQSPWGATWALPNVITVASMNSDGRLSSFSNFGPGVEIAAGGGVSDEAGGGDGVWSTGTSCFLRDTCYVQMSGTSMASPIVAGVAALVRSADGSMSAGEAGTCLVSSAGTSTGVVSRRSSQPHFDGMEFQIDFSGQIPILDAEAAVDCAQSGPKNAEVLIVGEGDRTSSGNGTDLGDVTAALEAAGHQVATSRELPGNLAGFEQIWHIDTEALGQEDQDRLAAYVGAGGSVYLTGEWGCCSVDTSTINLINRVVPDAAVAHGGHTGTDVYEIRSDAPYGLGTTPHRVATLQVSASGSLTGVAPGNIVAGDEASDQGVFVAWGPEAVTGGGRVVAVMDINWYAEQYRGSNWGSIIENVAAFLG